MTKSNIPETINHYYEIVKPLRRKLRRGIIIKCVGVNLIMKMIKGSITASECLNTLVRHYSLPGPMFLNDYACKKVFSKVAKDLFTQANLRLEDKGRSFGQLAYDSVLYLSSEEVAMDLLLNGFEFSYLPILNVQGQIEEVMLEFNREAIDLENLGQDWPLTLRSITFPVTDDHFVLRNKDVRSLASTSLETEIRNFLK